MERGMEVMEMEIEKGKDNGCDDIQQEIIQYTRLKMKRQRYRR
jgi:hypothetical protein